MNSIMRELSKTISLQFQSIVQILGTCKERTRHDLPGRNRRDLTAVGNCFGCTLCLLPSPSKRPSHAWSPSACSRVVEKRPRFGLRQFPKRAIKSHAYQLGEPDVKKF